MDYSTYIPPIVDGGGGGGGTVDLTVKPFPVNPMNYGAFADGANHILTSQDLIDHAAGGTKRLFIGPIVRTVTDGVTVNGSNIITSATANFTTADRGHLISCAGIPQNSIIKDVVDSATVHIVNNLNPLASAGNSAATVSATGVTIKIGDYDAGDYWDYVAIQEAVYMAFCNGSTTPNKSSWKLNRPLYLPAGAYRTNKPITMWEVQGGNVYGDGRLSTQVTSGVAGVPAWTCNGLWYTQFTGIQFFAAVGMNSFAGGGVNGGSSTSVIQDPLFIIDGNWDTLHTQGIQGNTFKDCHWDSSFLRDPLLALCPAGTASQGSENLYLNCHFNNPYRTSVTIYEANALQNTFIGGNFTQHITGINVNKGSANVYSTGFQARKPQQIDFNGYDFQVSNSADAHDSMAHCRSESFKMANIGNGAVGTLDSCVLDSVPPNSTWQANHAYVQGAIVEGLAAGNTNGHLHRCIVAGTSGGSEPVWTDTASGVPTVEVLDCSMTNGSTTITSAGANFANMTTGTLAGRGIFVIGAGASGATLYTTIVSHTDGSNMVLTDACANANGITGTRCVFGPITTDNTVSWVHDEFLEVLLNAPCTVRNCSFRWGAIRATNTTWPCVFEHCSFCRTDWEYLNAPGATPATNTAWFPTVLSQDGRFITTNQLTLGGGYNSGKAATTIAPPSRATAMTPTTGTISLTMARAVHTLTPTGDCTINATGGNGGDRNTFIITSSGTTSLTITFGTNFTSTGTLATGTVAAKVWTITFSCKDGTTWVETSRNGPM